MTIDHQGVNIASPPFFQHFFLEQPWLLLIFFLCIAAILRVIARQRNWPKVNLASLLAVLVALGIVALAWAIQTPREQLMAKTKAIVNATAPLNLSVLQQTIKADAPVLTPNEYLIGRFAQFQPQLKSYRITNQSLSGLSAQAHGNKGISLFTASTKFSHTALPVRSKWALYWQKDSHNKWQVTKIYWLKLLGRAPPKRFPRRR